MVLMAKPVVLHPYYLLLLVLFLSLDLSYQLQPSQSQYLLRIQQLLNYPPVLSSFNDTPDFCNIEPNPSLTIMCNEENITQIHIIGKVDGFARLHLYLSTNSFFDILGGLSGLKVLSLVSLGLQGHMPATVSQLSSLEILNVSSNHFTGSIPVSLSSLKNLQTLILDHNKFIGEVPGWLSLLPVLSVLSLKNNSLRGSLPSSIASMENLRILLLSKNHLSGQVPDLHHLTSLQVLELEDNKFGPHFPSLHNTLVTLVLRNNSFRFSIPPELASYYLLQKLDISLNRFAGPLLPSLLSLPSLHYLDISHNKLTGTLFDNMSCNPELAYVDLSSNLLSGDLPTCLKWRFKSRVVSYASNCLSSEEQEQHPSNFCHNEALAVKILPYDKKKHKRPYDKAVLASSTMGGTVGGTAIVSLIFLVIRKLYRKNALRKPQTRLTTESVSSVNTVKLLSDARYISQTMKLGASLPAYRTFALDELKEATNNFDAPNLLKGSDVQIYKGMLADGTLVTIRSLMVRKRQNQQTIGPHIELISKLRHSHLVSALGHCIDCCQDDSSTSRIFLVFEFVPNGTLRDIISGKKLTWTRRIGAAIGVAKGIQFLHTGVVPGVFSNNIKITDVLLDHDLHVKVSSHNLLLLAKNRGTVGAANSSPALRKNFSAREGDEDKKDVYDFGVILLEIIVGKPVMSKNEVTVLADMLQVSMTTEVTALRNIVDPAVCKESSDESLKTTIELCVRCLSDEPSDRPSVEGVLWNLQFAAQVQESWKGDSHSNQEAPLPCSHV